MLEYPVSRIDIAAGRLERKKDYVAEEKPLHIFVNQDRYVTILCTPRQTRELAIGHLLSEGIVKSIQEIKQVQLQKDGKCVVRLTSEVDVEKRIDRLSLSRIPTGLKVKAETVLESVKRLNTLAEIFRKTGGVHVAALYSASGDLLTSSEDIGRHNAVDKVVGAGALNNLDFERCFLASSGRLTGDIVLKSARMRIPIIGSIAAAVNSGIDVAQRTGTTLIGFARGRRMNVYTYAERIELA